MHYNNNKEHIVLNYRESQKRIVRHLHSITELLTLFKRHEDLSKEEELALLDVIFRLHQFQRYLTTILNSDENLFEDNITTYNKVISDAGQFINILNAVRNYQY